MTDVNESVISIALTRGQWLQVCQALRAHCEMQLDCIIYGCEKGDENCDESLAESIERYIKEKYDNPFMQVERK